MITVFYDWNTASSLTERYDYWFQTPPLHRSGLPTQRPTSSLTERYDCWRQTLPSRGLAQLDGILEGIYTKKSTWSAQSVLT